MASLKHPNRWGYVIILLTSLLLFFFFVSDQLNGFSRVVQPENLTNDARSYLVSADLLYHHFFSHPTRPLGYAFILGVPFLFDIGLEQHIIYAICLNFMCWLTTALLLFYSLLFFTSPKRALIFSFIFGSLMGQISNVFQVLPESIYILFITLSGHLFLRYHLQKEIKWLIWALSILFFATLFKPGIFYLAWLGLFISLIFYIRTWGFRLFLPLLISLVLVLSHMVITKHNYGNFTISYIDKVTWYTYLGARANTYAQNNDFKEELHQRNMTLRTNPWNSFSHISSQDMMYQIMHHPKEVVKGYLFNLSINGRGESYITLGNKTYIEGKNNQQIYPFWYWLSSLQNTLFSLLFIGLLLYWAFYIRHINFFIGYALLVSSYVIGTSGISFWQGDRFHSVIFPMLLLALAYSIEKRKNTSTNLY